MTDDLTIQWISLALDAALMRQTAIATNVANVNTKDYHRLSVDFEQQLHNFGTRPTTPRYVVDERSSAVALDEQMTLSVKNSTQFQALIRGLNQKLALMHIALQGVNAA
jgi:flagellar basal-body rod protein FlgB